MDSAQNHPEVISPADSHGGKFISNILFFSNNQIRIQLQSSKSCLSELQKGLCSCIYKAGIGAK